MQTKTPGTKASLWALAATIVLSLATAAANAQSANAASKSSGGGGGGSTPPPGTYAGRIVYTAKGVLHVFNLATNSNTSLGVSGVNPKFSRDGSRIVYQNSGIWIINSAVYATVTAALATGVSTLCGYALAKYRFSLRRPVFGVVVVEA